MHVPLAPKRGGALCAPGLVAHGMALCSLSLCAGIGGIDLGLRAGLDGAHRTVCYVERDAYCASVLAARMADGHLDDAPIWADLRTFDAEPWRGVVDIVTAGYPCTPFSYAGHRKGAEDPRHLWPYVAHIVATIRPTYVFCENVPGHLTMGFREVVNDLSRLGYTVKAGIFSAAEVGAHHMRKRLYFVAHAEHMPDGRELHNGREGAGSASLHAGGNGTPRSMAHSHSERQLQSQGSERGVRRRPSDGDSTTHTWPAEPSVGRVVNGLPHRMDRLKALGNAVVPATVELAWRTLNAR